MNTETFRGLRSTAYILEDCIASLDEIYEIIYGEKIIKIIGDTLCIE